VGDLRFTLTHSGVSRILIDRPGVPATTFGCGGDDISAILDDSASQPVENQCSSTSPAISGTFYPNQPLSGFNNQNINGSWTMTVNDFANQYGGVFNGWCLFVDYSTTP
jgi:hypothetical protein